MKRLSASDKKIAVEWARKHPRKLARIERGVTKFIARIARKARRRAKHRSTR